MSATAAQNQERTARRKRRQKRLVDATAPRIRVVWLGLDGARLTKLPPSVYPSLLEQGWDLRCPGCEEWTPWPAAECAHCRRRLKKLEPDGFSRLVIVDGSVALPRSDALKLGVALQDEAVEAAVKSWGALGHLRLLVSALLEGRHCYVALGEDE